MGNEHVNVTDNIIAMAARVNSYDYDDMDGNKRHSLIDDRRKWRKKALSSSIDEQRDWDRRKSDYDSRDPRYMDEPEQKIFGGIDRQRDNNMDGPSPYRNPPRHYEEDKMNMQQMMKSAEVSHALSYM